MINNIDIRRNDNGDVFYYQDGVLHNDFGPAVLLRRSDYYFTNDNSTVFEVEKYYKDGLLHRAGGKPAIIRANSDEYYENGKRHRVDGDAMTSEFCDWESCYIRGVAIELECGFASTHEWCQFLNENENENETYQMIHDQNGVIEMIKTPSPKQIRVHQMAHVL